MDLPDLPPDLTFHRLPPTAAALDDAFAAKRAALGPHIVGRWGWDDALQRAIHRRRFDEKPFLAIRQGETPLGTVSLHAKSDHVRLGEFYLFPPFQGRGLGSAILTHCLVATDGLGLPVNLEALHWNPVVSLYRRFGFVEVGGSDIHLFMERPPRRLL